MRKTLLSIVAILMAFTSQAVTRTLNNANPTAGQYTSWADVHAASSAGDTILVHGSLINYYSLHLTKKLVVIGPGHNPIDKQHAQKAFCDNILFGTNSTGSTVIGMEAGNMQAYAVDIDSVQILNCKILDALYFTQPNSNNWIVDGSIFTNSGYCMRAEANAVGDLIVRNCILNGTVFNFNGAFIGYNYFNNNIFLAASSYVFQYCRYFYVNDNIFYRAGFQDYANVGIQFNKNLSYQCLGGNTFPNGFNYESVDPLFVTNIGTGDYFAYTTDYHLQATSPVLTSASDGTELGVYGGVGDYDQYGIGHNPYIKTFNITGPTSVNAGDPIQVFIKAKVRN